MFADNAVKSLGEGSTLRLRVDRWRGVTLWQKSVNRGAEPGVAKSRTRGIEKQNRGVQKAEPGVSKSRTGGSEKQNRGKRKAEPGCLKSRTGGSEEQNRDNFRTIRVGDTLLVWEPP